MCIIMAKYIPTLGWVGVKNRDRGYRPVINIRRSNLDDIERMLLWDETTKYTEGLNEHGVAIISASMATINDEKQNTGTNEGTSKDYYSPDGKKIRQALRKNTCKDALNHLIETKLTGHTLVFDRNKCFLLESGWRHGEFIYKIEELNKDQQCVRTNHGVLLPWAGYQRVPGDPSHSRKRVSSEIRKIKAEIALNNCESLKDMIRSILDMSDKNPQMNTCRIDKREGYMTTTGQIVLIPSQRLLFYRPIDSDLNIRYSNSLDNGKCQFKILKDPKKLALS